MAPSPHAGCLMVGGEVSAAPFPSRWLPDGGRGGVCGAFSSRWRRDGGREGAGGAFPSRWLPGGGGRGGVCGTFSSRSLPDGGRGRWLRDGGPLAETKFRI